RILGSANNGAAVTVLERGDGPEEIGGAKHFWYRVQVDGRDLEGWMFGRFLKKRQVLVVATTDPSPGLSGADPSEADLEADPDEHKQREQPPSGKTGQAAPRAEASFLESPVRFREIAVLDHSRSFAVSGDLDRNGQPELLLVSEEGRGRYRLTGYEAGEGETGLQQVYAGTVNGRGVRGASVVTTSSGESFLAVEGEPYSILYRYDTQRGRFIQVRTLDSPLMAAGSLDGSSEHLVHLQRNRSPENDGTVTYTVTASKVEVSGNSLRVLDSVSYPYRLPVKKLLVFDLDGDGREEIVCEIGGKDRGGGVVVLGLRDQALARVEHTGFTTVQDRPFMHLWGVTVDGSPRLVLYTSDPAAGDDLGAEVGFLSATLEEGRLLPQGFRPVNKLLDEVNNGRIVLHHPTGAPQVPFIVLDHRSGGGYSVKMPVSGNAPGR
ncbi:MAG: hypothetical protein ACOC8N_03150, partial [Spirochaetota bacterium]